MVLMSQPLFMDMYSPVEGFNAFVECLNFEVTLQHGRFDIT